MHFKASLQLLLGSTFVLFTSQAYSQNVIGNWKLTSAQCANGNPITIDNAVLQFVDEAAFQSLEQVEQISGCSINVLGKYGISENQISLQPTQATSTQVCGFKPQVPQAAIDSFNVNGNQLTLQYATPDDNGPCPKGVVQTSVFTKQ